ncbi:hypothetical protein DFH06DRAFT_1333712 [Mycena polygramma]|nr:hypothetical protein DFH06DRAFT_1333712 [Mycena polygramma]
MVLREPASRAVDLPDSLLAVAVPSADMRHQVRNPEASFLPPRSLGAYPLLPSFRAVFSS